MTQSFELSPKGRFSRHRNLHRLSAKNAHRRSQATPISNLQGRISDNRILMSTLATEKLIYHPSEVDIRSR